MAAIPKVARAPLTAKQPDACPHCGSRSLSRRGTRRKKLEIAQLTIYALAHLTGISLFNFKCAWHYSRAQRSLFIAACGLTSRRNNFSAYHRQGMAQQSGLLCFAQYPFCEP